ncbi:S8 family serine peptidase [Bradyrhizobium lablabi]|nr:S8 family serine peptidase [Bradyrhizobium lablabi]
MKRGHAAMALAIVALPLVWLDAPAAFAQAIMRTPNLNIAPRTPTINPNVAPRVDLNVAGRTNVVTGVDRTPSRVNLAPTTPRTTARVNPNATMPVARYSPNLYPSCDAADRDSGGECSGKTADSGGGKGTSKGGGGKSAKKGKGGGGGAGSTLASTNRRIYPNQIVAELDGALSDTQADELARRHGLVRIESQNFPLIGATIGLFRITDNRPVDVVRREFAAAAGVRDVQFNFRYWLQQQKTSEGDPAQYAVTKLRLPQAHKLAHGMNVTVAVIDSGIDARHPELANTIADSFDALSSKDGPHVHGTGIAGAIAAHAKLMGSAPEARILAIRAFAPSSSGAESSSYIIVKSLNYAVLHGAQIVNMSFAGPKDPLIERGIIATAERGVLMIAAAGNAGPKSPPLYPAANPNVIAVSGTDSQDRLFPASNRGVHIALAAPGTDVFLPAPDGKYQMTSGTSFSAAYVSGIAALMLERNPALKPNDVRAILEKTARDLGAPGRDELFGAGQADAFAAVTAAGAAAVPMAAAPPKPADAAGGNDVSVSRAMNDTAASLSSEKPAVGGGNQPAAQ